MFIYRATILVWILKFAVANVEAQILHTENFTIILDTTNRFAGNVLPSFRFQNIREELLRFEITADFSYQFRKRAFTVANRFETSKLGNKIIFSGGYLYLEYRN